VNNPFGVRRLAKGRVLVLDYQRFIGYLEREEALELAARLVRAADPKGEKWPGVFRTVKGKRKAGGR
jgi:hypothetical protein